MSVEWAALDPSRFGRNVAVAMKSTVNLLLGVLVSSIELSETGEGE
jgi:hypothetical protein